MKLKTCIAHLHKFKMAAKIPQVDFDMKYQMTYNNG